MTPGWFTSSPPLILNKYLDEEYPDGARPMRLRNLHVVAFVQHDESTEVLQAVNVAVREE